MGRLAAVKLVHLYGYVSCHTAGPISYWSYWGCGDNQWNGINTQVNVVITDSKNQILLPPSQFLNTKVPSIKWYTVPGYNSLSPELVLPFFNYISQMGPSEPRITLVVRWKLGQAKRRQRRKSVRWCLCSLCVTEETQLLLFIRVFRKVRDKSEFRYNIFLTWLKFDRNCS